MFRIWRTRPLIRRTNLRQVRLHQVRLRQPNCQAAQLQRLRLSVSRRYSAANEANASPLPRFIRSAAETPQAQCLKRRKPEAGSSFAETCSRVSQDRVPIKPHHFCAGRHGDLQDLSPFRIGENIDLGKSAFPINSLEGSLESGAAIFAIGLCCRAEISVRSGLRKLQSFRDHALERFQI
jgi:hypothetical protein